MQISPRHIAYCACTASNEAKCFSAWWRCVCGCALWTQMNRNTYSEKKLICCEFNLIWSHEATAEWAKWDAASRYFCWLAAGSSLMNVNDSCSATCNSEAHYFPIVRNCYFDWGHVGVANNMQTIALLWSWKETTEEQNLQWFWAGEEAFQGWTKYSDGCAYGPCLTLRTTANTCSFSDRRSQFTNHCPQHHIWRPRVHILAPALPATPEYCLDLCIFSPGLSACSSCHESISVIPRASDETFYRGRFTHGKCVDFVQMIWYFVTAPDYA